MPPLNQRPPLDKLQRRLAFGAAIVLPPVIFAGFFWSVFRDFFQATPGRNHGFPVPLAIFCGVFLLMYLGGIIGMWFKLRQISQPVPVRLAADRRSAAAGPVFLILFSLPFAGIGVFALVQAVMKSLAGDLHDAAMLTLFGLVFGGVGFGLMIGTIRARKTSRQADDRKDRDPDRPWLWREDWAAGEIKDTGLGVAKFMLLWSVLALAMTTPAMLAFPKEWAKGNHAILVALLFPAVAFGFLGYVLRQWRSRRRFGPCLFKMAPVPAAPGGVLEGVIQTRTRVRLEHGLHLRIICLRRTVNGSGKDRSTSEAVLWQDEKVLAPQTSLPEPEPGRSAVPVFFKLPAGQPECSDAGSESILWRLEAKAKMAGPDFSASFEVPVFHQAGAPPAPVGKPDPTAALLMPVEALRRDEGSRIRVGSIPGGREFYFPAARNPGNAGVMTLIMLILGGVAWGTLKFHAPVLFPIIAGLLAVLMAIGCFNMWLRSSRVTINATRVSAVTRWLVFRRSREFATRDLVRVETKPGLVSGQTVFYDLQLVAKAGKRITVANTIASQPEADWLAREMTQALGRN